ncbi:hypothetical protein [Foetidibacter luteolus]|uniref:hypothetical protein n=1 Tax=Foetidibacter luteolus TaxID=2608880 RepID=UPI00129A4BB8|nr:hypothetical protein [Foetidibacter luteolus]
MKRGALQSFRIDRLTNSIQNTISGDSFQTEVSLLVLKDLKTITKKNRWLFNWKTELSDYSREVYKLTIVNNPDIIQGLLSISIEADHIFMNLVESAPFNVGKTKLYEGVAGNLVAYACRLSFQKGFDGFVAFDAKTKLINHYVKSLRAYHFGGQRMIITTEASQILVNRYFKN